MNIKNIFRNSLLLSGLIILSACIIVEDFNGQFEAAQKDSCLEKLVPDFYYSSFKKNREDGYAELTRGLTLSNGATYMMVKEQASDKGGHLYRFTVESGVFITHRPSPAARTQFKARYADSVIRVKEDTLTVPVLNDATLKILAETAMQDSYWREDEKRLYNNRADTDCLFDDRDLGKVDVDITE